MRRGHARARSSGATGAVPGEGSALPPSARAEDPGRAGADLGVATGASAGTETNLAGAGLDLGRGEGQAGADQGLRPTRASRAWARIVPALVVLAVILLFVFQNLKDVKVSFITASFTMPLAVDLIAAAALGAILVLAIGSVRILQLRRALRRRSASRATR